MFASFRYVAFSDEEPSGKEMGHYGSVPPFPQHHKN
jgi:hypothetical protein